MLTTDAWKDFMEVVRYCRGRYTCDGCLFYQQCNKEAFNSPSLVISAE